MRRSKRYPWALALCFAAACGGSEPQAHFDPADSGMHTPKDGSVGPGEDGSVGPQPLTFDAWKRELIDRICTRVSRCGDLGAISYGACRTLVATSFASIFERVGVTVGLGQLDFDAAKAATCLDDLEVAPCNEPVLGTFGLAGGQGACATFLRPAVDAGQPCSDISVISVCKNGYCGDDTGATALCGLTCHAYAGLSESCGGLSAPFCNPVSAYCNGASVCAARVANGDPCVGSDDCRLGFACDLSMHCVPNSVNVLGGPCSSSAGCDTGLVCAGEVCSAPLAMGDPCDVEDASCAPPLRCIAGHCGTPKAVGTTCVDGGYYECVDSVCYQGVCRAFVDSGDKCLVDSQCPRGLRCETTGAERRCGGKKPAASECTYDTECFDGLRCISGMCAKAPETVGDSCQGDCAPGFYCDTATQKCAVTGAMGASCGNDAACVSAFCAAGTCAAACTF